MHHKQIKKKKQHQQQQKKRRFWVSNIGLTGIQIDGLVEFAAPFSTFFSFAALNVTIKKKNKEGSIEKKLDFEILHVIWMK